MSKQSRAYNGMEAAVRHNDTQVESGMVLYHEPDESLFDEDEEPNLCFVCNEESDDWVCPACRKAITVERAAAYGKDQRTERSINGYYAMLFDDTDIEEILAREVEERKTYHLWRPDLIGRAQDFCVGRNLDGLQNYVDWLEARDGI